jgi:hypothetical protein
MLRPLVHGQMHRDELVAQSDGLSGTASASASGFTELGYEFGDCDQCVDVQLSLTLDENPAETGYSLSCDDTVVWNMPRYSFLTSEGLAHKTITDSACVDSFACCILTIQDSPLWQDGLTSPQAGRPGRFSTTYGDAIVAEYNGATDGPFINLSYEFGECGTAVR